MAEDFVSWVYDYRRRMVAYGVPENRRTDRIARAHFKTGRTAAAAARDERLAYVVLTRFHNQATAK